MTPEESQRIVSDALKNSNLIKPLSPEEQLGKRMEQLDHTVSRLLLEELQAVGFIRDRQATLNRLAGAYNDFLSSWHRDEVQKVLSCYMATALMERHR